MFKKTTLQILALLFLCSCQNTTDKPINKKDFDEIKNIIKRKEDYKPMKAKYIIDNLNNQLNLIELIKKEDVDDSQIPTFKVQIKDLEADYDSINQSKLEIKETNEILNNFIEITDAVMISMDKYKGYLYLELNFNNPFEKEILYTVLNYKYVDKYDTEYFNEKTKLTDEVAGNFKDTLAISTTEEYNDVAEFLYKKVPTKANDSLRKKLGKDKADKKAMSEFLKKGLQINTILIVFKDKTEISLEDAEWKYLEQ